MTVGPGRPHRAWSIAATTKTAATVDPQHIVCARARAKPMPGCFPALWPGDRCCFPGTKAIALAAAWSAHQRRNRALSTALRWTLSPNLPELGALFAAQSGPFVVGKSNNPTGNFFGKRAAGLWLAAARNIPLLIDEVFFRLRFF